MKRFYFIPLYYVGECKNSPKNLQGNEIPTRVYFQERFSTAIHFYALVWNFEIHSIGYKYFKNNSAEIDSEKAASEFLNTFVCIILDVNCWVIQNIENFFIIFFWHQIIHTGVEKVTL